MKGRTSLALAVFAALLSLSVRGVAQEATDQVQTRVSAPQDDGGVEAVSPQTQGVPAQQQAVATASQRDQEAAQSDTSLTERIMAESLFGLLLNGVVVGSFYAVIPWAQAKKRECLGETDCGDSAEIVTAVSLLIAIPAAFTVPLGVWLGGGLAGGDGSYGHALLGHLVGMAAGFGTSYLLAEVPRSAPSNALAIVQVTVAAVMQLTGAITGYELSSAANRRDKDHMAAKSRSSVRLMPIAAPTRQGALLGVSGEFL